MTATPNITAELEKVREISKRLRIKADIIQMGERIAFGSDSEIMPEAADTLDTLIAKQKATEEALRVAVEGLEFYLNRELGYSTWMAAMKEDLGGCADKAFAKINTILEETHQ